ncbi:hypothetical protein GQ53DRAFT_337961 [Thozetella sp. PMI_491]|nr:hypothetical protein GQ53DRAFT_337961 [Thozetella sp. PMI_491]
MCYWDAFRTRNWAVGKARGSSRPVWSRFPSLELTFGPLGRTIDYQKAPRSPGLSGERYVICTLLPGRTQGRQQQPPPPVPREISFRQSHDKAFGGGKVHRGSATYDGSKWCADQSRLKNGSPIAADQQAAVPGPVWSALAFGCRSAQTQHPRRVLVHGRILATLEVCGERASEVSGRVAGGGSLDLNTVPECGVTCRSIVVGQAQIRCNLVVLWSA